MTTPPEARVVEELLQDFESRYSYLYQGTVYENGGGNFSPVHESVKHWLRTTLHQELQKVRHDWLREEIVKLEEEQRKHNCPPDDGNDYDHGAYVALQTIIDRYQSELDQPTV